MKYLQKAAKQAAASASNQEKIESLSKAFEMFSLETVRLETAYDSLGEQFQQLNLELQDSNNKLQNKVAELDVITDYLKNILDNMAQGILFIDFNGRITTCNRAAETILGIKSQEIIFKRFWDVFKDDLFSFSMKAGLEKKDAEGTYNVSYTSPSHHHAELEITASFAFNKAEKASPTDGNQGLIVMIRDVTEMRHLQTIAARADRMKVLGEMAAQVAHEIRNPLGGIKGFASLLQRDLAGQPSLQKMAASIVEGTDNLNNLVSQVLHYARPVQPHPEKTNLTALVDNIRTHIEADANIKRKRIAVKVEAPPGKIILQVDPALIKSALLNLAVNSIEAMPDGGTLTLSVSEKPGHVILAVADTGTGITEENVRKLYSPFFTTKPEGNGLGLIEVQKVAQAHGGAIELDTEIGRGTTFSLKLPIGNQGNNSRKDI